MINQTRTLLLFVLAVDVSDVINGTFEVLTLYNLCNHCYPICFADLLFQTVLQSGFGQVTTFEDSGYQSGD